MILLKFQALKIRLTNKLNNKDQLSKKIFKNILLSFVVKAGSIAVGLILIPMTISYISPVEYGVWLTISSVISWMSFFDIGLGNGLRNRLTTAVALKDFKKAKGYISTTYATLIVISIFLFLIIFFVTPIINWRSFLNIPSSVSENMEIILLIVLGSFCIQFILQIINTILTALHEPAIAGSITFAGQACVLICVAILKNTIPGNLYILISALTLIPILIFIIATFVLFKSKLKVYSPEFNLINFAFVKEIINIGGSFFFIQIGALVLYQSNNIIIAKVLGPLAVTEFSVAFKLFTVISMIFVIIVTPYWSGFTNAYTLNDYKWLNKNVSMIRKIWVFLSFLAIILYFLSPFIFKLWLGDTLKITKTFSFAMLIYVVTYMWHIINAYFLNGLGKVRVQLILIVIGAAINIPLATYLAGKYGISGVIYSNSIIFIFMNIFFTIQVQKILKNKASGIWSR